MHQSDNFDKYTCAFSCYLDESGTHDQSPYTVMAGLLLDGHQFLALGKLWDKLLCDLRIEPPIHMKEFGRPHGRLGYLSDSKRYLLFKELVGIINSNKFISLSGTIDQYQFNEILNLNKHKEFSPYSLCFMMCAYLVNEQANYLKYNKDISFTLERATEHRGQILSAYDVMIDWQKTKPLHMGSFDINGDKNLPVLQAADIIAWGTLRRLKREPFNQGYEYIDKIFNENHLQAPWDIDNIQGLARRLMKYEDQNH